MKDKLSILWTNDNPITAELMVFMYARNAIKQNWWKEVDLIIWGATAKLVGENTDIQESIKEVQESGVKVRACRACAEELGVDKVLESLGIEVEYMGIALTEALKGEGQVLSV